MPEGTYKYKNIDLMTATVFDIADISFLNENILTLGITREFVLNSYKKNTNARIFDLLEYAESIDDKSLLEKLENLYSNEIALAFNE